MAAVRHTFSGKPFRRRAIIGLVLVGAFFAAWYIAGQSGDYVSDARIMVERPPWDEVEAETFYGAQSELMLSREVRSRAIDRVAKLHPGSTATDVRISATRISHTSIFEVKAKGRDPIYTQQFLLAILTEYRAIRNALRVSIEAAAEAAIRDEVARLEKELHTEEHELAEYVKTHDVSLVRRRVDPTGVQQIVDYEQLKNRIEGGNERRERLLTTLYDAVYGCRSIPSPTILENASASRPYRTLGFLPF